MNPLNTLAAANLTSRFLNTNYSTYMHLFFITDAMVILHCPPKVKVQPALLSSSFVHNSSINEIKNMKLSEHICFEMIN